MTSTAGTRPIHRWSQPTGGARTNVIMHAKRHGDDHGLRPVQDGDDEHASRET